MVNRDQIIVQAFAKLGMPGDGDTLTAAQETQGEENLHTMLRHFRAVHGMPLWKTTTEEFDFSLFTSGRGVLGVGEALESTTVPLKVLDVWRVDNTVAASPIRTPMQMYERERWYNLSNPSQTGAPNILFADIKKDTIELNVWPKPDAYWAAASGGTLAVTITREFTEMANDTSIPDFPDHWEEAIIYSLATRLAPNYGLSMGERQMLKQEAAEMVDVALSFDNEVGSIFLRPTTNPVR